MSVVISCAELFTKIREVGSFCTSLVNDEMQVLEVKCPVISVRF